LPFQPKINPSAQGNPCSNKNKVRGQCTVFAKSHMKACVVSTFADKDEKNRVGAIF
jgi:hypothetical protein